MRKILVRITVLVAIIGVGFIVYPFIMALTPSEAVLAEQPFITVDLSKLKEGEVRRYTMDGLPVLVLHRTQEQLAQLSDLKEYRDHIGINTAVPDPDNINSEFRSILPQYYIVYGWTGNEIQCGSSYVTAMDIYPDIKGGFIEQCRGAWHDVTGRLLKRSWAEGGDLPIPPYEFIGESTIKIGPISKHRFRKWRKKDKQS